MKFLLLILSAASAFAAVSTNRLYLTWNDDPTYDTNVSFFVYSQTNVALPLSGWVVATNISYSAWKNSPERKPGEAGAVEIPPAVAYQRFFAVTASNLFGESDFSVAVSSRRLLPPTGLKIGAAEKSASSVSFPIPIPMSQSLPGGSNLVVIIPPIIIPPTLPSGTSNVVISPVLILSP